MEFFNNSEFWGGLIFTIGVFFMGSVFGYYMAKDFYFSNKG